MATEPCGFIRYRSAHSLSWNSTGFRQGEPLGIYFIWCSCEPGTVYSRDSVRTRRLIHRTDAVLAVVILNRGLGVLIANSNAQTGSVLQPGRLLVKRLSPRLFSRGDHTASQPMVQLLPCNHSGNGVNRSINGQLLLSTNCRSRHSSRIIRLCQPVFSFLVGAYAASPASGAEGLEHIGPTQVCFAYRAILQRLTQARFLVTRSLHPHLIWLDVQPIFHS